MAKRQPQPQPPKAESLCVSRFPSFDDLPDSAWVRQSQLVSNPKKPGVPVLLPFSAASLWRKVTDGSFPKPVKLSSRTTAWNAGSIRAWLAAQKEEGQ